ncbi:hypothetical protein ABZ345_04995 [Lentzea sp. NPDC005914]|uniref:hypothetical protein n=1 Tax=Lentzea sp. NPDC005914 TaxID=3154572 RepID=UPI0033F5DD6E
MVTHTREVIEYNNETYYAGTESDGKIWIVKIPGETYATDEGFEHCEDLRRKQVPIRELDAWYRDEMTAKWRGQPFVVHPNRDGTMGADYVGPSQVWAEDNGLEGDPYNGFHKIIPEDELEDVQVDRTDYLARWKEKNPG